MLELKQLLMYVGMTHLDVYCRDVTYNVIAIVNNRKRRYALIVHQFQSLSELRIAAAEM